MKMKEREIILKNGTKAVLRSPEKEDAPGLIDYLRTVAGETEFILRAPEEVTMTVENEEQWIESGVGSDNKLLVCCCVDGRIVGNCEIVFFTGMKTRHRAGIGIAVISEYWNLGVGTAMFETLIDAAREHGTEIVELDYVKGNERARHLYEKVGFRAVCEKPDIFRFKDGSYHDEVYMQKRM